MVEHVKVHWSLWALCIAPLLGCKDEGKPFLPADELCPRLVADICAARERCECEASGNCPRDELARCETQAALFEGDDDLVYDAEQAASVAAEQARALEACEPPFALGRFYDGTRAEGADCERDALCESGSCDPDAQICSPPETVELCPAP
jgi:hypothetical protein